jgi:hypothetical protein
MKGGIKRYANEKWCPRGSMEMSSGFILDEIVEDRPDLEQTLSRPLAFLKLEAWRT